MASSKPSSSNKMFPAATLADQEAVVNKEMAPVVLGIPPFSSPNPVTDGHRMVPVSAPVRSVAEDGKKRAGDWIAEVNSAKTQEELDDVAGRYDESGSNFKTVDEAIDKKQSEISEQ